MTKRIWLAVLMVVALTCAAHADTTWVSDSIVAGFWSAANSPYMIQRSVTVRASDSLYINPGVTVYFVGPYRFNVFGYFRAMGAVDDSIRFTTDTLAHPNRWRGVRFLSAPDSCRMEYCLIENGYGTSPADDRYGGGIECQTCAPTFSHCTIRYCKAVLDGGGVYVRDNAAPRFFDCEISHCFTLLGGGGGLFSRSSNPQFTRCVIRSNRSLNTGGGIGIIAHSVPLTLANCLIEDNRGGEGGGIYMRSRMVTITLQNCIFRGDSANRGGAAFDSAVSVQYINCLLTSNVADSGSAIYSTDNSHTRLNFCTLAENFSPNMTLFARRDTLSLTNSVISAGASTAVALSNPIAASVSYCDVFAMQTFSGDIPPGLGWLNRVNVWGDSCDTFVNLFRNPQFEDTANFRLSDTSRCLGAAWDPNHTVPTDLDTLSRPSPDNSRPDMGAYENRLDNGSAIYLQGEQHGTLGPGRFLVGADMTIPAQDTLRIAPGTRLNFISRSRFIVNGLLLAVGTVDDSITFFADTLDNPGRWLGIEFRSSSPLCSLAYCHVTLSDSGNIRLINATPALDHCLLDYGRATNGGGLFASSGSASITNTLFHNNSATAGGGGVFMQDNSQPQFAGCTFRTNSVSINGLGGAVCLTDSTGGAFSGCLFEQNVSGHFGGAVHETTGNPVFDHCVFDRNSATAGGGVSLAHSRAVIMRCTFSGNVALPDTHNAAAIHLDTSQPIITSSIFSYSRGKGMVFVSSGSASIRACDFWGNTTSNFGYSTGGDHPANIGVLNHVNARRDSCDQYYNVFVRPLYADSALHDFHLTQFSHCIDAGDSALPQDPDVTIADIGAFYFPHTNAASNRFSPYPLSLRLCAAPNPFNPVTEIRYDLPKSGVVTLKIFDLLGREVETLMDKRAEAGTYTISWNAESLPSGMYFAILESGDKQLIQKLLLLK